MVPSVTRRPFSMKSSSRSSGLPTSGLTMPLAPSGITWADTALERVGDQRDLGGAAGDARDLAGQPAGGDHRLVLAHAVARALVDLHASSTRRWASGRSRARPRGSVPCGKPSERPELDQAAQLLGVARARSRPRRAACAGPRPRPCSSSFSPLASKRVAEPAEQVARTGLSARLAPVSIGANASWAPRWSVWKKPPPGLAEVGGEHDDGQRDEYRQRRPSAADHLAVEHFRAPPEPPPVSGGGSFGNSCCCGGWPRTPRGCGRSRPPRT